MERNIEVAKSDDTRCPVCQRLYQFKKKTMKHRKPTKHHILPRRFFGNNNGTVTLCRGCHDELETHIPKKKMLPQKKYLEIVNHFLRQKALQMKNSIQAHVIPSPNTNDFITFLFPINVYEKNVDSHEIFRAWIKQHEI